MSRFTTRARIASKPDPTVSGLTGYVALSNARGTCENTFRPNQQRLVGWVLFGQMFVVVDNTFFFISRIYIPTISKGKKRIHTLL